jgi:hypothetical protein
MDKVAKVRRQQRAADAGRYTAQAAVRCERAVSAHDASSRDFGKIQLLRSL